MVNQNNDRTGLFLRAGSLRPPSGARFVTAAPVLAANASLSGLKFTGSDLFYMRASAPTVGGPRTTVSNTSPTQMSPAQTPSAPAQVFRFRR